MYVDVRVFGNVCMYVNACMSVAVCVAAATELAREYDTVSSLSPVHLDKPVVVWPASGRRGSQTAPSFPCEHFAQALTRKMGRERSEVAGRHEGRVHECGRGRRKTRDLHASVDRIAVSSSSATGCMQEGTTEVTREVW